MALTKMFGVLSMAGIVSITAYGMGCSSSTKGGGTTPQDSGTVQTGDSGNKTDGSGTKDTGPASDATGSQSDATGTQDSGDTGSSCASTTPFQKITWAPPTAFGQGKCTDAQITSYVSMLTNAMATALPTSGSPTCDACLQTDQTAAAHGPVITVSEMGMEVPASINFGGCIYNEDKVAADMTATGCGAMVNNFQDCFGQECGSCSDANNPMTGGPTDTCLMQACSAEQLTMACDSELQVDGSIQLCLGQITPIFEAWCGGATATDGGTPEAGPTDGGTEQ